MKRKADKRHPHASKSKTPAIDITESPDYKAVYASGVFGGMDPNDSRLIFFLDRIKPKIKKSRKTVMEIDKINRELQVEIRMSPNQFISVAKWMNEHAEKFSKRMKSGNKKDSSASYIG